MSRMIRAVVATFAVASLAFVAVPPQASAQSAKDMAKLEATKASIDDALTEVKRAYKAAESASNAKEWKAAAPTLESALGNLRGALKEADALGYSTGGAKDGLERVKALSAVVGTQVDDGRFDNPLAGFDNPLVGFDNPLVGIEKEAVEGDEGPLGKTR